MKSNFLVIIFSGVSVSLLGVLLLIMPICVKNLVENNLECFLTIPPVAVASYILVFKYHENLQGIAPTFTELFQKIFQGAITAFVCFFLMAIISSLLFRIYTLIEKA